MAKETRYKLTAVFDGDERGAVRATQRTRAEFDKLEKQHDKTRAANIRHQRAQARMDRHMRNMAATAARAAVGIGAIVTAGAGVGNAVQGMRTFERSLSRIEGLVGIAGDQVDAMGDALVRLSPEVAKAPTELAEALFFVTSAGFRGAEALQIVEQSARASVAGLGETAQIADVVTSAVNAYSAENLSAARTTDILTAAVRAGKLEATTLGPALADVVGTASALDIGLADVAGTLAVFSRTGTNAAKGATTLNGIFNALLNTSAEGERALAGVNLSLAELRRIAREDGVIAVMQTLDAAFEGNITRLRAVIPETEAFRGIMNVLSQDGKAVAQVLRDVEHSTGVANQSFQVAARTTDHELNQAVTRLNTNMQALADRTLPGVVDQLSEVAGHMAHIAEQEGGLSALNTLLSLGTPTGSVVPFARAIGSRFQPRQVASDIEAAIAPTQRFLDVLAGSAEAGRNFVEIVQQGGAVVIPFREGMETGAVAVERYSQSLADQIAQQSRVLELVARGISLQEAETRARLEAQGAGEQQIREFLAQQRQMDAARERSAESTDAQAEAEARLREQITLSTRQLDLMRGGMSATDALARAQIETATGLNAEYMLLQQQVASLTATQDALRDAYQRNLDIITGVSDETRAYQERVTDLRELHARGELSIDQYNAAMARLGDTAGGLTDELQRLFEKRFGTEISAELAESLGGIEQVREALGDIDTPFQLSIDRMLAGLQSFEVATAKAGAEAAQHLTAGTAQMLSGVQQLATEGSSAYEKIGVAVKALHTATAIQAILNQGAAGDPFSAVGRMLAMAGLVASLGVSVGGGLGGGGSPSRNANATGTGGGAFGAIDARTESIANSVEISARANEAIVGINTNMLRSLQGLQHGIGGFSRLLVQRADGIGTVGGLSGATVGASGGRNLAAVGGSLIQPGADLLAIGDLIGVNDVVSGLVGDLFGDTAGGIADLLLGGVSDLLGGVFEGIAGGLFGGGEEVRRRGIEVIGGTVADLLDDTFVQGFARIRRSRGIRGPSYRTEFSELPDVLEQQFSLVLDQVVDSAVLTAQALDVDQAAIDRALESVTIDTTQIRTDQSGEKIKEQLNTLFSTVLDDLTGSMVGFLDQFVQFGEGLFETATRVATNISGTQAVLERLGGTVSQAADFGLFNNNARLDPAQLAALSTAFVEAAGGIDALAQSSSDFVNEFLGQERALDNQRRELANAFEQLGVALPDTREGFASLVQQFRITDEASAETVAQLLALAPALDAVFDAAERITEEREDLQLRLLRAQGDELAALNIERQRELDAVSDSNRALLQRVHAAEDAARAEEAAARAAEEAARAHQQLRDSIRSTTQSLAQEIARLRNESVAAVHIGNVLSALNGAGTPQDLVNAAGGIQAALTQQLQEQLQAIQDQSAALDRKNQAEIDALNSQITAVNEQIRAAEQLRDIAAGIRGYITGLGFSDLGGGTPQQQLEAAQQELFRLATAARGGDVDAARQVTQIADRVLQLNQDVNASGPAAAAIREAVKGTLNSVANSIDVTAPELQALEQQLGVMEQQKQLLQKILDNQPIQVDGINAAADTHSERLREETARQLQGVQGILALIEDVTLLSKNEQVSALAVLREALATVIRGGSLDTVEGLGDVRDAISDAMRGIVSGDEAITRILDGGFDTLAGAFRDQIIGLASDVSGLSEELTRATLGSADDVAAAIDAANREALRQARIGADLTLAGLRAVGVETSGMRADLVRQFHEQILEQQLTARLTDILGAETRGVQQLVQAAANIISGNVTASGAQIVSELFGLGRLQGLTADQIADAIRSGDFGVLGALADVERAVRDTKAFEASILSRFGDQFGGLINGLVDDARRSTPPQNTGSTRPSTGPTTEPTTGPTTSTQPVPDVSGPTRREVKALFDQVRSAAFVAEQQKLITVQRNSGGALSLAINMNRIIAQAGDVAIQAARDAVREAYPNQTFFQFRTGGIARGPEAGYQVELHGTEAIMPTVRMPDGNFGVRAAQGNNDDVVRELRELRQRFDRLQESYDALIRVEQSGWRQSLEQGDEQLRNSNEMARAARRQAAA